MLHDLMHQYINCIDKAINESPFMPANLGISLPWIDHMYKSYQTSGIKLHILNPARSYKREGIYFCETTTQRFENISIRRLSILFSKQTPLSNSSFQTPLSTPILKFRDRHCLPYLI